MGGWSTKGGSTEVLKVGVLKDGVLKVGVLGWGWRTNRTADDELALGSERRVETADGEVEDGIGGDTPELVVSDFSNFAPTSLRSSRRFSSSGIRVSASRSRNTESRGWSVAKERSAPLRKRGNGKAEKSEVAVEVSDSTSGAVTETTIRAVVSSDVSCDEGG